MGGIRHHDRVGGEQLAEPGEQEAQLLGGGVGWRWSEAGSSRVLRAVKLSRCICENLLFGTVTTLCSGVRMRVERSPMLSIVPNASP